MLSVDPCPPEPSSKTLDMAKYSGLLLGKSGRSEEPDTRLEEGPNGETLPMLLIEKAPFMSCGEGGTEPTIPAAWL